MQLETYKLQVFNAMAGSMCFNTCVQHTLVERMEIDVNSAYMVSFDARSIGKELSKGYFFIDCFDTNGYSIQSVEVNRKLQAGLISNRVFEL